MPSFSVTDAAFEGFRLTREQPRTILSWALALLVMNLVTAVLLILLVGPDWADLQAALRNPSQDPAESVALFRRLLPVYAITLPVGLLFGAVLQSAACRAVLGEAGGGPGHLAFGGNELRVLLAQLALMVLMFGTSVLGGVVVGLVGALVGAPLLVFVLLGALIVVLLWVWARLSLAPVQSFAERRVAVFGSWRLTRGQGWKLVGTYVLAFMLALVVMLLLLAIYAALMAVIGGGLAAAGSIFQPDYSSFATYFRPGMIVGVLVGAVISAMFYAVMLTPAVVAYRSIATARTAQVFA
jgi:hypothetical protein